MGSNLKGGRAFFISHPDGQNLREILQKWVYDKDVDYPFDPELQYIHKVINGKNVFYFANVGSSYVKTEITLRGKMDLEEWDSHSGDIRSAGAKSLQNEALDFITLVKLDLKPYHSCFLVEGEAASRK